MTSNFTTISLTTQASLAILTLKRPEKLNCISVNMITELRQAIKQIGDDDAIRCLLITGSGKGFCSGQDLNERANVRTQTPDLGASLEKNYNPLIRDIKSLSIPIICAVNGVAAGAGANLALSCDIVMAARSAYFVQSFCKIGLIPDCGGTWTLPHLIGQARAMGLALLGDKLEAEIAEQWGMIYKCVDDEVLMPECIALGERLAKQPTTGLSLIKQAIAASTTNTFDQQLDLERELQSQAGRTADYAEGVEAFLQKRTPKFTGK